MRRMRLERVRQAKGPDIGRVHDIHLRAVRLVRQVIVLQRTAVVNIRAGVGGQLVGQTRREVRRERGGLEILGVRGVAGRSHGILVAELTECGRLQENASGEASS